MSFYDKTQLVVPILMNHNFLNTIYIYIYIYIYDLGRIQMKMSYDINV